METQVYFSEFQTRLMRFLVTSNILCDCESWTLTAEVQRKIQAMEMTYNRKTLSFSYEDHVTNEDVRAKTLYWTTADVEIKIQLVRRTQSLMVFPLKPKVGRNKTMHASPTARDFFLELISTAPVHSPALSFQTISRVFPVLAVATPGSFGGLQNKIGHLAHRYDAGSRVEPAEYK